MSHRRSRSRSPKSRNRSSSTRENWRLRQERTDTRRDNFSSNRAKGGPRRWDRRWSDSDKRWSDSDRRDGRDRENVQTKDYPEDRDRREKQERTDLQSYSNEGDNSDEEDTRRRGRFERERRGDKYRRSSRRHSAEEKEEKIKPIVLNPTDVPKAERYFAHDDRLEGKNSRSRRRIDSTPSKWGHDMFDKLQSEEKEGTPPPENEADDNYKTKSVVSKVEVVTPIMDVFTPGSEDFDSVIQLEDPL